MIQINMDESWVSDSPYLHVFDGLEGVHHQMEEQALEKAMSEIDYHAIRNLNLLRRSVCFVDEDVGLAVK